MEIEEKKKQKKYALKRNIKVYMLVNIARAL